MIGDESPSTKTFERRAADKSRPETGSPLLGFLLLAVVFLIAGFWQRAPNFKTFLQREWILLVAGAFVLLCCLMTIGSVRRRLKSASVATRVALMMIVLGGLSALVIGGVVVLPANVQRAALKSVFLLAACLFPPILYYLFISTRKYSLFSEFILNLDRLGLLKRRRLAPQCVKRNEIVESDSSRGLRIRAYLERFEAVYGPLGALVNDIVESDDIPRLLARTKREIASGGLASIFNQGSTAPLIISTVLIALGWFLVMPPMPLRDEALPSDVDLFVRPVYFAFLGAYFFTIQMLFRRYLRKDLRGSAYTSASMRILLAVIGTWVILQLKSLVWTQGDAEASVLAFAIGFFPPVAWQIVRQALKPMTGILFPSLEAQLPLSDLDGLNVWHQTRLEEEDVESIPNMATVDIVDLLLNTRIPPERIIDWVDQAILYTHLSQYHDLKYRAKLRAHGIRTASGLLYAYERSECQLDRPIFEAILPHEPDGRSPIRGIAMALFTNPNLCLIQAWRGLTIASDEVAVLPRHEAHSEVSNPEPPTQITNGKLAVQLS